MIEHAAKLSIPRYNSDDKDQFLRIHLLSHLIRGYENDAILDEEGNNVCLTQIDSEQYHRYMGNLVACVSSSLYVRPALLDSSRREEFAQYANHIAPLRLVIEGDTLIIGPGVNELGIVETAVADGDVSRLTLIDNYSLDWLSPYINLLKHHPVPVEISPRGSWGGFADADLAAKDRKLDTILFFGKPGTAHLIDWMQEFSNNLNPGGHFFMTVNAPFPQNPPLIDDCYIEYVPNIPISPTYDAFSYFGVRGVKRLPAQ